MFGHNFYWGLTRKYVSYFGTIFNDIYITRTIKGGSAPSDLMRVPLTYASKDKMITRVTQDPNINTPYAITLPRMSFEIDGSLNYDSSRNLSILNRYAFRDTDPNKANYLYTPYPVNIPFVLHIYVKNTEDGTKILEQILPFFKPEWTASVQLVPEASITMDIPIEHISTSIDDKYEGDFKERQVLTYTLKFMMRAVYFGPTYKKPIIKFVDVNTRIPVGNTTAEDAVGNTDVIGTISIQPGLDANGSPTSNSANSVDVYTIEVTDDFGYVVTVSGMKLNETEE